MAQYHANMQAETSCSDPAPPVSLLSGFSCCTFLRCPAEMVELRTIIAFWFLKSNLTPLQQEPRCPGWAQPTSRALIQLQMPEILSANIPFCSLGIKLRPLLRHMLVTWGELAWQWLEASTWRGGIVRWGMDGGKGNNHFCLVRGGGGGGSLKNIFSDGVMYFELRLPSDLPDFCEWVDIYWWL